MIKRVAHFASARRSIPLRVDQNGVARQRIFIYYLHISLHSLNLQKMRAEWAR